MRRFRFLSRFVIVAGTFLCADVYAEDLKVPKQFYEDGYAHTPLEKEATSKSYKDREDIFREKEVSDTEQAVTATDKSYQADSTEVDESRESITALAKAIPVKSLGVILNSLDFKHLQEKLDEMLEAAILYDYRLGFIYTIGDMLNVGNIPEDKMIALAMREGTLKIVGTIPGRYNVKMSPTWILEVEDGEILLEATGPLAQHLNQRGEFLDKPNSKYKKIEYQEIPETESEKEEESNLEAKALNNSINGEI